MSDLTAVLIILAITALGQFAAIRLSPDLKYLPLIQTLIGGLAIAYVTIS